MGWPPSSPKKPLKSPAPWQVHEAVIDATQNMTFRKNPVFSKKNTAVRELAKGIPCKQ